MFKNSTQTTVNALSKLNFTNANYFWDFQRKNRKWQQYCTNDIFKKVRRDVNLNTQKQIKILIQTN